MTTDNKTRLMNVLTAGESPEEVFLMGIQGIIAAQISMKRQMMGMNQKQFSEFMGVSQGLVSKWESGDTNFTLSSLVHIASKLDIEMQCPFVTAPPPAYHELRNVIRFRNKDWDGLMYPQVGYEANELEEM